MSLTQQFCVLQSHFIILEMSNLYIAFEEPRQRSLALISLLEKDSFEFFKPIMIFSAYSCTKFQHLLSFGQEQLSPEYEQKLSG